MIVILENNILLDFRINLVRNRSKSLVSQINREMEVFAKFAKQHSTNNSKPSKTANGVKILRSVIKMDNPRFKFLLNLKKILKTINVIYKNYTLVHLNQSSSNFPI